MKQFIFADWWEDRGDPLDVLDDAFHFVASLEIERQTDKAVFARVSLWSRAEGHHDGGFEWIPKSAFIYADFDSFRKIDRKAIARRVAFLEKIGFHEYAAEIKTIISDKE